jgi:hypothetical protein
MAANPNPSHITNEMWWFIEEWERLESETVFAGAWGDWKPGYHCDFWTLKHTAGWQYDYSVQLADDQVGGGHPNEHMGAAVDITFPSAQSGNYSKIRKYTDRIRAAWKARDPRLKGWREVLGNSSDGDSPADGYDFVYWTERSPDDSHEWHLHFSCLRKYVNNLTVFQAMMSILRGETLAQWQTRGDVMAQVFLWQGNIWISRGGAKEREKVCPLPAGTTQTPEANVVTDAHQVYPGEDSRGYPTPDLKTRDWTEALVDLTFGRVATSGGGGTGGGASAEQVQAIVHQELAKLKMVSDLE